MTFFGLHRRITEGLLLTRRCDPIGRDDDCPRSAVSALGGIALDQKATGLARRASAVIILPIAGLMGGVLIGALRAKGRGLDELGQIACVIKWGVTGFFGGLALIVLLAFRGWREPQVSLRETMVFIAVAAIVAWFFGRVLSAAIGYEGF